MVGIVPIPVRCREIFATDFVPQLQLWNRVIQKDGLKEPVPVVGGMAWIVNGASTHAIQLVSVF